MRKRFRGDPISRQISHESTDAKMPPVSSDEGGVGDRQTTKPMERTE